MGVADPAPFDDLSLPSRHLALHGGRPKSTVWSAPHRRLSFGARVFEDADYLLIPTFREEDGEDRYKVIGIVDGKFWTAVHIRHGDTVRFISVRRSNDGEEKQYLA